MDSFLKMVARDLCQRLHGDCTRTVVVFPNERAKLYFNDYLAVAASTPIFAPTYMSIREMIASMATKKIGDPITLICRLYDVFHSACGGTETLDDFYFWGQMLLEDFNDVDKALVDARALFCNIEALRQMDDMSFLTADQVEALQHFFSNISAGAGTSTIKERFAYVWGRLLTIYDTYRCALAEEGIAYEGMLYREVVEHLNTAALPYDKYVFVGFNVLTRAEQRLFTLLQKANKALFYWDYDTAYIDKTNHEAATYLAPNLRMFPSPLPRDAFSSFLNDKDIQFVEASTETAQARYLQQWTKDNLTSPERDTAIVLCNEGLLAPVLHSLPAAVAKVNVTMGYPLIHTPVYSLLVAVMESHILGYDDKRGTFRLSKILPLLRHPFLARLAPTVTALTATLSATNRLSPYPAELGDDDILRRLFTPVADKVALCALLQETLQRVADTFRTLSPEEENDPLLPIYREALFRAITVMNRFRLLIDGGDLASIKMTTFGEFLKKMLATERIPFHSEPAEGLQIMGVIETRNLDFRHVIVLSCNEGYLPRGNGDTSFIPYTLRKAFDMPTIDHKIALYAYYFYRLLQRAEKVTMVYNTVNDGRQKGEMSRFMLQLLVDTPHSVERLSLATQQQPQRGVVIIPKTKAVVERLTKRYVEEKRVLSPSALNAYLDCPLCFYLRYVAGLKVQEEADEEVDNAMFGTIFHRVVEEIYSTLAAEDPLITAGRLAPLLRDKEKVLRYIDEAFREEFFQTTRQEIEYNGIQRINREVIAKYVHNLLTMDAAAAPFTFLAAEKKEYGTFSVATAQGEIQVQIGGVIDRMDRQQDGTLRIIDYKTGGAPRPYKEMGDLIVPDKKRANYIFQIFLYATILRQRTDGEDLLPQIVYVNRAKAKDYHTFIRCGTDSNYEEITTFTKEMADDFRSIVEQVVQEIFDTAVPFTPTTIPDKCKHCDFATFCTPSTL